MMVVFLNCLFCTGQWFKKKLSKYVSVFFTWELRSHLSKREIKMTARESIFKIEGSEKNGE